jgi:hypothetical protein
MSKDRDRVSVPLLIGGIWLLAVPSVHGELPDRRDALVVRLLHPEQQAAAVLRLFEGARVSHPAAALAAWKRATKDSAQLGKSLEAVIALFNPEMVPEWRVFDDAELRLEPSAVDGRARWFVLVPRDDGAVAAAITAMRLTGGVDEQPLDWDGRAYCVQRLGPAGAMVATRDGDTLLLGSSRAKLLDGLRLVGLRRGPAQAGSPRLTSRRRAAFSLRDERPECGVLFDLIPDSLTAGVGAMPYRRGVAFLNGLNCRRIEGRLALDGDDLSMVVTSFLERPTNPGQVAADAETAVQPAWLRWVPAEGVMAVVSIAVAPGREFWDSVFELADQVDRADPARAGLAPLRARLNLVASAAGARPEVDLWPHLIGVTAGVMGNPSQPGRPTGALVVLHTDGDASAERLTTDVVPRLAAFFSRTKQGAENPQVVGADRPVKVRSADDARRVGALLGRSLLVVRRGRDVIAAWGDDVLRASIATANRPECSVAPWCTAWARAGKHPPQRVGAIWPARCWLSTRGFDLAAPAWRVLTESPPVVWWGWNEAGKRSDAIHCLGLRQRVHSFLAELPLAPSPIE